jgi:hypothetical protein
MTPRDVSANLPRTAAVAAAIGKWIDNGQKRRIVKRPRRNKDPKQATLKTD